MNLNRYTTKLAEIYGPEQAPAVAARLGRLVEAYRGRIPAPADPSLTQRDSLLITYADQVQEPGRPPLEALGEFCRERLQGVVSGIHFLPFFPWSSDDGFSVKDYRAIDPAMG